jgi:hypothetical protein
VGENDSQITDQPASVNPEASLHNVCFALIAVSAVGDACNDQRSGKMSFSLNMALPNLPTAKFPDDDLHECLGFRFLLNFTD